MKRIIIAFTTVMLLTMALSTAAFASSYDSTAQELQTIGMFKGTGSGFALDRAPTRAEAAIMLVRLYGAEDEANAQYAEGKISHPFTDVNAYNSPYVAWLYEKGMTKGTNATTFGSSDKCSDKMYCTFMLRALGYADGTDFAYNDALTFAQQKGFYSELTASDTFLRDDLVAVTYQALSTNLKDGSTYLLDSLVKSGAVDKTAAAPIMKKMETYRAMSKSMTTMDSNSMDADIKMTMDMGITYNGEQTNSVSDTTGNVKMIIDGDNIQMAYTMSMKSEGETTTMNMWVKDGWAYFNMTAAGQTTMYKYEIGDALDEIKSMANLEMIDTDMSTLAMFKSIDSKKSGSDTVYTVVMDGAAIGGMVDDIMGSMGDLVGEDMGQFSMNVGDITMTATVSSADVLKSMAMKFKMDMNISYQGETMAAVYDYDMTMTINAVGNGVKITYPDFSGYKTLDTAAVADIAA